MKNIPTTLVITLILTSCVAAPSSEINCDDTVAKTSFETKWCAENNAVDYEVKWKQRKYVYENGFISEEISLD